MSQTIQDLLAIQRAATQGRRDADTSKRTGEAANEGPWVWMSPPIPPPLSPVADICMNCRSPEDAAQIAASDPGRVAALVECAIELRRVTANICDRMFDDQGMPIPMSTECKLRGSDELVWCDPCRARKALAALAAQGVEL